MAATDDGQAAGVTNGIADAKAVVAGNTGSNAVPVPPATVATVQTFVSGTAKQISATNRSDLYINITTAAALAIAMGPTSATAVAVSVSQSSALGVVTLHVPVGWYVKLTGTMGNLVTTSVLLV